MHSTLLIVHILAAATWIGGSMSVLFLVPRMRASGNAAASAFAAGYEKMGRAYFPPAAVVVLLSGIWLVLDSSAYEFEDGFVMVGIGVVVAGALLGSLVFGPTARRARSAHDAADDAAAADAYKRFNGAGLVDVALLVFAVYAMVTKLGS